MLFATTNLLAPTLRPHLALYTNNDTVIPWAYSPTVNFGVGVAVCIASLLGAPQLAAATTSRLTAPLAWPLDS